MARELNQFDQWLLGRKTIAPFEPGISAYRQRIVPKEAPINDEEYEGSNYAKMYQLNDDKAAQESASLLDSFERCRIQGPGMSCLEDDTTYCSDVPHSLSTELKLKCNAYSEFDFTLPATKKILPIHSKREEILNLLEKENAIVVRGFTGCGKTTQVPQFILDQCYSRHSPCNIVVTQPRRIAAISVAKRVSEERKWPLGTVVGYMVGMERQLNDYTCLTYMTTGCLLQKLVTKKSLEDFTHVIIDEVHERDEDTDLLLMVVRKFLRDTRSPAKVILMSATADATKFSQYFRTVTSNEFVNAPIVEVEAEAPFPVRVYYLDDLCKIEFLQAYVMTVNPLEPKIEDKTYSAAARLISALDEKREISRFGRYENTVLSNCRGSVLIFLPGLAEIETMHKVLRSFEEAADSDQKYCWYVLPFHSRITSEEQSRVFHGLPENKKNYRKIILSTNIAESSLTVPDIIYVIDFCLHKQVVADPQTNFCSLRLEWAPRSSCIQRKGRVGRVNEGVVYRMVTKDFFDNELKEDPIPEILRCPLEHAVLRTKLLNLGEPKSLLALVIDAPSLKNIVKTIATLKEIGALFATVNGKVTIDDGDLSYLGRVISYLPIDVHLGKLIMLGYVFNMFEESIIIAAGLSSKNIFTSPYQKKLLAYLVKMLWADGSFSDPITILNAYQLWKEYHRIEHFKRSGQSEKQREQQWAKDYFIQLKALTEMDALVGEIKHRLRQLGIESPSGPNIRPLNTEQKALLIRVIIFGAFYPNYFSRQATSGEEPEREAVRALCGSDPYSTVQLGSFPSDQPHLAYTRQIKNQVENHIFKIYSNAAWNVNVSFNCSRVFLHFYQEGNTTQKEIITGKIGLPVYLAVKQRLLRMPYEIQLMLPSIAEMYSRKVKESVKRYLRDPSFSDTESLASSHTAIMDMPFAIEIPPCRVPELVENSISVSVCHVEEPNHFWFHRIDERSKRDYSHLTRIIGPGGRNLKSYNDSIPLNKGNLVMGPFSANGEQPEYYRCKILSIHNNTSSSSYLRQVRIFFIDFGNTAEALVKDLRMVPPELLDIAPIALEAILTGVGPSLIRDPKGKWIPEAKAWFKERTIDRPFTAQIFSVVDNVTSLDLIPEAPEESLASQLLLKKYALKVEESYFSKKNNAERQNAVNAQMYGTRYHPTTNEQTLRQAAAEQLAMDYDVPQLEGGKGFRTLKGPFSPLEMQMAGKIQSLIGYHIRVEDDSVNSVMLDDQLQGHHERVLVAAQVGVQMKDHHVLLRNTTMLPNIPGLPALLTLIFTPRAEYRTNERRTRLTGALCGLGFDPETNRSFYPEHDMEIAFDTEITLNDVVLINKVRYWLNSVLGERSHSQYQSAPATERMREISSNVLSLIFELINSQRKDVDVIPSYRHKWNQVKPEHILKGDLSENQRLNVIPLHDCVKLVP